MVLYYFFFGIVVVTGMHAAVINGIDGFVFTAGIGENAPAIREAVVRRLAWLGLELDATGNAQGEMLSSSRQSRLPCYVIATDEELMIAKHTLRVLHARTSQEK